MVSRCSECSANVKPVVAIDVDGTLSEYHDALAQHIIRYFGVPLPWGMWNGEGDYEDYLGISNEQYREAKLAYRQGGNKRWSREMPSLWTLRDTISRLKEKNLVEIWVTTTRPWLRLDNVDPDTRYWLDQHFPVYDHLLYHDDKYFELAKRVDSERVVAVIDDLPPMVAQAGLSFPAAKVRMHPRHHNATAPGEIIRETLAEFAGTIEKEVERWWMT